MIRVLIADDSAFARKVIREVLSGDPDIEVIGIARDGLDALEKIAELKPDVLTLDLVMPDLDGIGVLKAMRAQGSNVRAVVVSVSGSETELAIEALHLGAIDLVNKPTPLPTDRLYELSGELVEKVKAAALAKPKFSAASEINLAPSLTPASVGQKASVSLLVIGTSTGGPQAITQIFKRLPVGLPIPIVVALHIPPGYTKAIAARITAMGFIKMTEAVDGMLLQPGEAVIAPGGQHVTISRRGDRFLASVSEEPRHLIYHPSVNLLFTSAAAAAGDGALAVIMTGMGDDGTDGARAIQEAGGRILVESEASCIVFGMPRAALEAGVVNAQALLEDLPRLVVSKIFEKLDRP